MKMHVHFPEDFPLQGIERNAFGPQVRLTV